MKLVRHQRSKNHEEYEDVQRARRGRGERPEGVLIDWDAQTS